MTLDRTGAPEEIVGVRATLSRDDYEPVVIMFDMTEQTATEGFDAVAVGVWHLRVDALDADETVRYTGDARVTGTAGVTTTVDLVFLPSSGSIVVNVRRGPRKSDSSLYLDGDRDQAVNENPSDALVNLTTAVTFEAWVRPANQYYNPVIVLGQAAYFFDLAKFRRPGLILWGVTPDYSGAEYYWGRLLMPISVPANEWSHIAWTFDARSGIAVYVNGNRVYETATVGEIDTADELGRDVSDRIFRVGARFWSYVNWNYFDGYIDEVRVWNVARTDDEIAEWMTQELTGDEPFLAGYWNFNDGRRSRVAADLTVNGNDLTLEGDAQLVKVGPF